MERLPSDTVSAGGDVSLVCPWCRQDPGQATVTLDQLAWSHGQGGLQFAPRCELGLADEDGLVAECPHCEKPFLVALQSSGKPDEGQPVRLLAVRTAKDLELQMTPRRGDG